MSDKRKQNTRSIVAVLFAAAFLYAPVVFAGPYEDGLAADSDRNYAVSFPAFQRAVEQGHVKAHLKLANNYRFGKGTPKSGAKAIELYEAAAALGEASAFAEIAGMYEFGEGVPKSPAKVAEWARKGAEAGHFMGQYKLGQALQTGEGTAKDLPKALYWYQQAAAQGHMMSQGRRDMLTKQGVLVWQPPAPVGTASRAASSAASAEKAALIQALRAPDQGSNGYDKCTASTPAYNFGTLVSLCDNSGSMYELMAQITDPPVTRIQKDAFHLKAANAFTSAMKYRFLSGAPKQHTCDTRDRALELFAQSTQFPPEGSAVGAGFKEASSQIYIGMCGPIKTPPMSKPVNTAQDLSQDNSLSVNDGILAYEREDFATALRVWRYHAERGDAMAQTYLGALYYLGKGVEKSYDQAVYWHRKSAAQGDAYGQLNLAECYEKGLGVEPDLQEALRLYNLSAAQNMELAIEGAARVEKQIALESSSTVNSTALDADQLFNTCVNSGAGVPTQLGYAACIDAFNALIVKAQKPGLTTGQKRLSWASAGKAAGIAVLQKFQIDDAQTMDTALNPTICSIAINGMKAYSQVNPPGSTDEMGGVFTPSASLSSIAQKCANKAQ